MEKSAIVEALKSKIKELRAEIGQHENALQALDPVTAAKVVQPGAKKRGRPKKAQPAEHADTEPPGKDEAAE